MPSYQFISDLSTSILLKSAAIQGRFHVSDRNATEINSDVVGELLTDATTQIFGEQKYPLAIMLPPVSMGEMNAGNGWMDYNLTLFFLRTTYYDAFNQIEDINPNTQTSQRAVIKDWEEMGTVANNYAKSLDIVMRTPSAGDEPATATYFRVKGNTKRITPVTKVGTDRASGVMLTVSVSLFSGCELSDIDIANVVAALPPKAAETDPIWTGDKPNYYTKSDVDALIDDSSGASYRLTFSNASTVSCPHNFGKSSVLVQIYDTTGNAIQGSIQKVDNNNLLINFSPVASGEVIIKS